MTREMGNVRLMAGYAVGILCFVVLASWILFVWEAFNLAEVAEWITYTAMIATAAFWIVISVLLVKSVILNRKGDTLILGGVVGFIVLLNVVMVALHFTVNWPF